MAIDKIEIPAAYNDEHLRLDRIIQQNDEMIGILQSIALSTVKIANPPPPGEVDLREPKRGRR